MTQRYTYAPTILDNGRHMSPQEIVDVLNELTAIVVRQRAAEVELAQLKEDIQETREAVLDHLANSNICDRALDYTGRLLWELIQPDRKECNEE